MIDMILPGCCVSGAGCVVLADWPAGSTGSHSLPFPCGLYLSDLIAAFLDRFALLFGHKKGLIGLFLIQICITYWPNKGLSGLFFGLLSKTDLIAPFLDRFALLLA
jgi:hypothetical protein